MDRPTFSQSWSRVSRLAPTLRPHVRIHRQLYRGEPWHVVHDPVSNNFFRLNPVAYYLVGLFDGKRSIDEVWRLTLDRYGDEAPTQNEVIGLLGQLNQSNLLRVDMPADAAPLIEREQRRKIKHWAGQAMSILFMRIPVFNPDPMLRCVLPLVRPLLNKWTLLLWLGWVVFCLTQFLPHLRVFARDAGSVLAPTNWGWMVLLFILTKAVHEFGHGIVCRRLGGAVPQFGIMLLVLFPAPFVDATSSWNFPNKWQRWLVGAAGMIFELAIAGLAALVWIHAEDASLVKQLAYNVVFLASVTTILFNANPLLRFDGYYMLSDLLEVPNLYERSGRHLRWIVQRFAYGVRSVQPVSSDSYERTVMTLYGIASQIYRVVILFSIILFISGKLETVGYALAIWSVIAWGVIPLCKFIHWLGTSPALTEHRARAVLVTLTFAISVFLGVGVIPAADHRRADGVVESAVRAEVAMQTNGFVREVHVETGQFVRKGDIILLAENPDLNARRVEIDAQLVNMAIAERQGLASDINSMKMAQARRLALEEEKRRVEQQLADLVLRSPQDGTVSGGVMKHLQDRYIKRGQVVARVLDLDDIRVTAMVSQAQNASPFFSQIEKVELRTVGNTRNVIEGTLLQAFPAGRYDLPHPALSYAGGGTIAVDPSDRQGRRTTRPHFELWVGLPEPSADDDANASGSTAAAADHAVRPLPGQRVYVRFTLAERKPLMFQWIHRLRQVLRERLSS